MIDCVCPQCQVSLTVDPTYANREVRCPKCDTIFMPQVPISPPEKNHPANDEPGPTTTTSHETPTDEAPATEEYWLRIPEGVEFGPVDANLLDSWVSEGRVASDCAMRMSTTSLWEPASKWYPVLIESGNPFMRASAPRTPNIQSHRGGRLFLLSLLGCVIPLVSFGVSTIALQDLRRMESQQMDPTGEPATRAAQLISVLASIVWITVIGITFLVLMFQAL